MNTRLNFLYILLMYLQILRRSCPSVKCLLMKLLFIYMFVFNLCRRTRSSLVQVTHNVALYYISVVFKLFFFFFKIKLENLRFFLEKFWFWSRCAYFPEEPPTEPGGASHCVSPVVSLK